MIKGIIFDLDGTLLYTLEDLKNATNYVLNSHGLDGISIEQTKLFIGNGVRKLLERAFNVYGKKYQESYYEEFRKYYGIHLADNTIPYDGIVETIEKLHKNNIKMSVCSNKYQEGVSKVCTPYFKETIDYFIGTGDNIRTKPNLDMICLALNKMNIDEKSCLYVGDSDTDLQTAKKANIKFIGVSWGYRDSLLLKENGADYIIDTPTQLLDIIRKENEND